MAASAATPPSDNAYGNWNWEQLMNGVFGLGLPSRTDVQNEPWLVFTTGNDTDQNRPHIFWAYADSAKVNVYYSDQVTGQTKDSSGGSTVSSGSSWQNWHDMPNQALPPAAFNQNYSQLPHYNPKTLYDVADAFQYTANQLGAMSDSLANQYNGLSDGNNSFKGKAAGAFRDLLGNVRVATSGFRDQIGSSGNSYAQVMAAAALAAGNFVVGMWNAYYGWANSSVATPFQAVASLVMPLASTTTIPGHYESS